MFKTASDAIQFIESRIVKSSFKSYQEKLKKYAIDTNFTRFIHVTGTNGKGSTVNYLSHLLQQAHFRVGTFTSPYMVSYHDRICINDKPISDEDLLAIVNQYYEMINNENLSKFEIDVLIMLVYFKKKKIDYGIIEVGIGGLNDKTNVIYSIMSLITNVGYDHMPSLGTTLQEVCRQKAGIIKENSIALTTVQELDLLNIISKVSNEKKAQMIQVVLPKVTRFPIQFNYLGYQINLNNQALYQINNFCLALSALKSLEVPLTQEQVNDAIKHSLWPGRFEIINDRVIIDGAHNINGIEALCKTLKAKNEPFTIIFSALRDKDYPLMIEKLSQHYLVYLTVFEDERQIDLDLLKGYPYVFKNFQDAYQSALALDQKIIFTGSLHFISEVRRFFKTS